MKVRTETKSQVISEVLQQLKGKYVFLKPQPKWKGLFGATLPPAITQQSPALGSSWKGCNQICASSAEISILRFVQH